jgi:dTDP-4-amino-4,6-dideoxygalactose transaminase
MTIDLPFTRPSIDEETIAGVVEVLRSGWITTGPNVATLESALAQYLGGDRSVRVMTSATGGLEICLLAAGIGPGSEVIVPAMTFVASANVVLRVGARPVFVDVDLTTRNLIPESLERVVTPRTRAIMPVHFAGLAVDLDPVYALAKQQNLRVIEDAAHAIGTSYKGRRIGSFGDLVCFSFHPNKNMTTIEGGAISCTNADEVRTIELERWHGQVRDADGNNDVVRAGGKYNLTDVAARVGVGQLKSLDKFNARRRELAERYFNLLEGKFHGVLPARGDDGHSWHIFGVLIPFSEHGLTRPQFIKAMEQRGIGIGVHYPNVAALSLFKGLGYRG